MFTFILYLQENSEKKDNWNQKAWEDLVLKVRLLRLCKPKGYSTVQCLNNRLQGLFVLFTCLLAALAHSFISNHVFLVFLLSLLQFVSKSLDEVDSEEWVGSLGAEMSAQIQLYTNFPEEKVWHIRQSGLPGLLSIACSLHRMQFTS